MDDIDLFNPIQHMKLYHLTQTTFWIYDEIVIILYNNSTPK